MEENKILVILVVPELDKSYDMLLPLNRKIGNIIEMISNFLAKETKNEYQINNHRNLYNSENGLKYDFNLLMKDTTISNGSKIILM